VSQTSAARARVDPLGPLLAALEHARATPQQAPSRLGIVQGVDDAGAVLVTFDGEQAVSGRSYPRLASYAPVAGDRVLMLRAGASWVAVGSLAGVAAVTPSSSSSSSSSSAGAPLQLPGAAWTLELTDDCGVVDPDAFGGTTVPSGSGGSS
jgi:hypothetical protein